MTQEPGGGAPAADTEAEPTQQPPAVPPEAPPPGGGLVRTALAVLAILASIGVLIGFYVTLEPPDQRLAPAGVDTPWYVWRSELVSRGGLEALTGSVLPPYRAQPFRAGFPVMAAFLDSGVGISPAELAYITPALVAAILGLAAGALAVRVLGEPVWAFPVYAVGVGASLSFLLTAISHLDNLLVNALLVAAAVPLLAANGGRRTLAGGIVLLAGAALTHWSFTALFAAMAVGLALLLAPGSLRDRRAGAPLLATPSARLGLSVGGAAALAGGAFLIGPGLPELPRTGTRNLLPKLERDLPRFAPVAALAAGGVPALLVPRDRTRRHGLLFLLIWALSAAAAGALVWAGVSIAAHRILHFALGIPLLAVAAVVGVGRALGRLRPRAIGATVAGLLVLAALTVSLAWVRDFWRPLPERHALARQQAVLAAGYVATLEGRSQIVYVVNPRRAIQPISTIRAVLPADQITRSHLFVGRPEDALAGRPTIVADDPLLTRVSTRHRDGLGAVLDRAVLISVSAFDRPGTDVEGIPLGPGVVLLRGPSSGGDVAPVPILSPPSVADLVRMVVAALLVLGLVGSGWALGLLPGGWLPRAALAPSLGVAVLVLAGTLGAPIGLDLPGARPWVLVGAALLGWALLVMAWHRQRSRAAGDEARRGESTK